MTKQQNLKPLRNYLENPRRSTESDPEYREDLDGFEETKTKQSDLEASDINFIMKRYERTGELPNMIKSEASYGDFSDVASFQEALNIVQFAEMQFQSLDAQVRRRFNNDPAQFLEFTNSPENLPEMVTLGLAVERPQAPVASPTPKGTASTTKKTPPAPPEE